MEKLIERGYAGARARAGDKNAWNGADLHAKQAPRDDSIAQAGKVTWLNGLLEQIIEIVRVEFPDNPDLQSVRLLHKWASSPSTLIEGLCKPNLILLSVDLVDKVEEKSICFEDIVASYEVKYANSPTLSRLARAQTVELGVFSASLPFANIPGEDHECQQPST
ncbi:hypothetical protein SCLCIDRAFT_21811 [Scleroderma citrinum Foug A]|uniref:Uncharacterized protein n=1 Tax=Scleroderma citrinum Foug A TaxID=1036808 RepID=A0A0C2ZZ18_9AGAM|nr:hypothetical protein SCLCIDRAFT_21811 [Scleroderma citrinum Foug A]